MSLRNDKAGRRSGHLFIPSFVGNGMLLHRTTRVSSDVCRRSRRVVRSGRGSARVFAQVGDRPEAGHSDDATTEYLQPLEEPVIVDLSSPPQRTKKVRQRTGNLIGEIDRELDVADTLDSADLPPVHLDDMAECARTAVRAADQRKALDPVVFRVANVSTVTTFMVCVTGKNSPQIRAIANLVEDELLKYHDMKPKQTSRTPNSGWLLLDYGDLMVHVFSPEQRINYQMESLWRKGEQMDISDCLVGIPDDDESGLSSDEDDWLTDDDSGSAFATDKWGKSS